MIIIHSFSCKNFYSFGDPTTIDFVVNDNAPDNNGYFKAPSSVRLSKAEIVIGPNASGKTNLLKALPFLKWLITDSYNLNPSAPLPVKPFLFGDYTNNPIELSVVFEIDSDIYFYGFKLNETKILEEELKVKNKTREKSTIKKVFYRKWDEKSNKYEFEEKKFNLPKGFPKMLRSNASIIETAIRSNHEESKKIYTAWQQVETNVVEAGWVGNSLLHSSNIQLLDAFDFYSNIENKKLKEEAEKLLSQFDLGLAGFEVSKQKTENGAPRFTAQVAHFFGGQKGYLPMHYESSGTQQLFTLLKTILLVLNKGGIAVLDEFDVNLHPEMVSHLFDLFIQPETNPKNAQLLLSTHSHMVLSKLDKQQIVLVEKNEKGVSEAWRLDEVSGVRADDNYYAKYIAGAYGAVPKL